MQKNQRDRDINGTKVMVMLLMFFRSLDISTSDNLSKDLTVWLRVNFMYD